MRSSGSTVSNQAGQFLDTSNPVAYVEKILTSAWELILIGIFCGFGNPKKSSQIRRDLLRICKFRKILRKSAESCGFERTAFSNPQKITFIHENANTRNFAMNNSHPKRILEFETIHSACNSWLCYERTSFSNPQKITFLHENANTRNFAMKNFHPKKIFEFDKILSACNPWLCYGRTSFSIPQAFPFLLFTMVA